MCTMLLGDMGAEVIKIEYPVHGDETREWAPFVGGWSTYYLSVNRNKKSVAIDLKSEEGKRLLEELIGLADVLVENFRRTLERLGFGPERARSMNERLIYCSISGYGTTGPLPRSSRLRHGDPGRVGPDGRHRISGNGADQGRRRDYRLHCRALRGAGHSPARHQPLADGEGTVSRSGAPRFGVFRARAARRHRRGQRKKSRPARQRTSEPCAVRPVSRSRRRRHRRGRQSALVVPLLFGDRRRSTSSTIRALRPTMPAWRTGHRSTTPSGRCSRTRAWTRSSKGSRPPAFRAAGYGRSTKCSADPQLAARRMFFDIATSDGPVKMPGNPIKLSDLAALPNAAPPALGQHTKEISDRAAKPPGGW